MSSKKEIIWFTKGAGLPYEFSALNDKHRLMAKSFLAAGYDVYLTSKLGVKEKDEALTYKGIYDGVLFWFLNKRVAHYRSFVGRQVDILTGFKEELVFFIANRMTKIHIIISFTWIHHLLYYYFISKIFNIQLVFNVMEWYPDVKARGTLKRCNDYLFYKLSKYAFKKAIPISHYIDDKIKENYCKTKTYILPAITDVASYKTVNVELLNFNYFIYCGNAGYDEVIRFLIDAYICFPYKSNVSLKLVLSGSKEKISSIVDYIAEKKMQDNVEIYSAIPYDELYDLYAGALALLIPLRQTHQDKARFPHKIAEYSASLRPIITNDWGEVAFYFEDMKNAYVCDDYCAKQFCDKMIEAYNNVDGNSEIANSAYNICKDHFDYHIHSAYLKKLLDL